ncbi:MAG: hypothetical protein JJ992_19680, partial [Planctomycetes bacterium]|nr:hypothetical protein [Planctomycetota bacterium]
ALANGPAPRATEQSVAPVPNRPAESPETFPGSLADEDLHAFWEGWSQRLAGDGFESLDTLTEGIRPITAYLTTALDTLRTTFPLTEDEPGVGSTEDSASTAGASAERLMG